MNGVIREIDIRNVEGTELRHTARGTVQEVDHSFLAERPAYTAHGFKFQGRHRQPLRTIDANGRNPADNVLPDEIFLRTPLEEAIQAQADALQGAVHDVVGLFILEEIDTDIVGRDLIDRLMHGGEELGEPEKVQAQRAGRQMLNTLGSNVHSHGLRDGLCGDDVGALPGDIIISRDGVEKCEYVGDV